MEDGVVDRVVLMPADLPGVPGAVRGVCCRLRRALVGVFGEEWRGERDPGDIAGSSTSCNSALVCNSCLSRASRHVRSSSEWHSLEASALSSSEMA